MSKKNMSCGYAKNKKMNSDVYKKRREVIKYIYEAKKLLGDAFRRIDVRITEKMPNNYLGVGRNNHDIIWIPETTVIEYNGSKLRHIVFHEIAHTLFAARHHRKSYLMHPSLPAVCNDEKMDKGLISIAKRSK